ncbi:MAG TPA: aminoglycoside phosphotransferase [Actinomycetes bacterium]|nr:aminoglycoside phosphotransferase [Actinomycetes bacterium]
MPAVEGPGLDRLTEQAAAAADPHLLLPDLHQREGTQMEGTLSMAAVTELAPGQWLGVFRAGDGDCLAAPFGLDEGRPTRARPGDGAAQALITQLRPGHPELSNGFRLTSFVGEDSPAPARWAGGALERPMLVDQTHESVVVGDRAVVKWAVRAEPTPAPVLIAHLRAAGFKEMPEPWGFVSWADGSDELLVASVVQYLPGATDGWTWAVADAADFVVRDAGLESAASNLSAVGPVVADMHMAMATPTSVIGSPESIADHGELLEWRDLALGLLREATGSVDGPEGDRLATLGPKIVEAIQGLGAVDETTTIPVHGDLHVGQVLRWDGGFALGDFDGNPVLPVTTRLSAQPAARDVAGMMQSIDHVGRVVLRRVEGADPDGVREWIAVAQQRFLDSYRERLGECGREALFDDRLMLAFRAEQECREFLYAVRHLPRWRYVPDQALQALFGHG